MENVILTGQKRRMIINFYLLKTIKLTVPEPSGLALSFDNDRFWSVSDVNSTVYYLNIDGKVLKSFKINGEDLEGITVVDTNEIAVILDRTREVVLLDNTGKEINRVKLNLNGKLNE